MREPARRVMLTVSFPVPTPPRSAVWRAGRYYGMPEDWRTYIEPGRGVQGWWIELWLPAELVSD